ncbi:class I SAM-dependent methyltransferase [Desulfonema magnum]|uniref:Methyltransferase domain-containing protein n=1 Tax=Desulfonema magnum TaxID=45655 RepID=A0A975GNP7_9BACT|nr:class I SAM-dependent methyltransferase [Desulfonema magnum]QTA88002.1 Methyltransferase domain-containing protein [Desulfonema magnum]
MIDHFDLIAPLYDWFIGTPDTKQLRYLLQLPTRGRLLDVGGGTGRVSSRLRPWVGQVVITDISRPMLKRARARENLYPVEAKAESLPFPDEQFERILVVDSLHHFHNQPHAVRDLLRVLRPGGRLVIEEPDIRRFAVNVVALAEKLALMGSHFHSPEEIHDMITAYGLSAGIERNNSFRAWIVADK